MILDLNQSYTLTDLLNKARELFSEKKLRQISFVFHNELTYQIEYTDSRTNRFRYVQIKDTFGTTMAYYDWDKVDVAINDLYRDTRVEIRMLGSISLEAVTNIKLKLYPSGEKVPVVYKTLAGGFSYVKEKE